MKTLRCVYLRDEKYVWHHMIAGFCAVMLFLFLACMPVAAVDAATAAVTNVEIETEETAEVTVTITENPGLAAWMFELHWDTDALTLDDKNEVPVKEGSGFSGGTLLYKKTDDGVRVSWFNMQNVSADGTLFTLRLRAGADASGIWPIEIICSQKNTINVDEQEIPIVTVNGAVTVGNTNSSGNEPEPSTIPPPDPPLDPLPDSSPEPTPDPLPDPSPGPSEPPQLVAFTDISPNDYYYEAVCWAVDNGVTKGTTETTFSPATPCTRAQAVTFLWRAAGSPEPKSGRNPFGDLKTDSYYYKAVLWAVEEGITNGTTATTFSPNATVTRSQVVTFLYRAAGTEKTDGGNPFTDIKSSEYYTDAVLWAVAKGITNGTSVTTFSPWQNCTRGQIVTFLYRTKLGEENRQ